jgi:hypothetical protein
LSTVGEPGLQTVLSLALIHFALCLSNSAS